jgi:hypothetical protein
MKTCRYAVLALLGVLITLTFLPISAQETPAMRLGDRVRVTYGTVERQEMDGVFQGVEGTDLLVLSRETSEVHRIPTGSVERSRVYQGKKRHHWTGFGIGGGAGAVAGFALSLIVVQSWGCFSDGFYGLERVECETSGEGAAIVGFGLIGGLAGALIGSFIKTDRWEPVSLPSVQPSFQGSPVGRFRLGLSLPTRR